MRWTPMSDFYIVKSQKNLQLLLTVAFCDCPNTLQIKINLLQENSDSLNHIIYHRKLRESDSTTAPS